MTIYEGVVFWLIINQIVGIWYLERAIQGGKS